MDGIYQNIEEYNLNNKSKILIVFYDMVTDMLTNKRLNTLATEPFIRDCKLNISLVFNAQSYFAVPKNIRLICTHSFIMKIRKER